MNKLLKLCKNPNLSTVFDQIKELVKNKEQLNYEDVYLSRKPMYYLLTNKSVTLDQVKYLNDNGINMTDEDICGTATPLICTCKNEEVKLDIMKYLIEIGVNVNRVEFWEDDALYHLCNNPDVTLEKIKCLVENGVISDKHSIINLCKNPNSTLEQIKYLVNFSETKELDSDALFAVLGNHDNSFENIFEIVKFLIEEKGLDVNYRNGHYSCLTVLCENIMIFKKLEIVRYIKNYINDIDEEIKLVLRLKYMKDELKYEIIDELNKVDSTTKSAAKSTYIE
jgi:hypothetical protein